MSENITYARGRVVELQDEITQNEIAINALKREVVAEANGEFDTDKIRALLNKVDLFDAELSRAKTDLNVIKKQLGL